MTAGPVNRVLLQTFYQNVGDVYRDDMTEGAFNTLADQIDANAIVFSPTGSQNIPSPAIAGLTTLVVYDQLVELEGQVQNLVGGVTPPGTITNAMIQDRTIQAIKIALGVLTYAEDDTQGKLSRIGGTVYAYKNIPGFL